MPVKDHLPNMEEVNRNRWRSIKKNAAINYQGAPPTITANLTGVGKDVKTDNESRNTGFPILYPIDDESGNVSNSVDVDLSLEEAHYHQIQISDNGGTVSNINVNFINIPKNKAVSFFLDFIKDPGNVSTPTITFIPALANLPAGFPLDASRYLYQIIGKNNPVETRYEVVSGGTGSGGGGGGTLPMGSFENEHLEWNHTTMMWVPAQVLTMGTTGPFADSGFIRYANNQIMLSARNAFNDGNVEVKVDSADAVDITESMNAPVWLKLRSQHAVDPDQILSIIQYPSAATGVTEYRAPLLAKFMIGGVTNVFDYDSTRVGVYKPVNMLGNEINRIAQIEFEGIHTLGANDAGIAHDNAGKVMRYNAPFTDHTHRFYAANQLLATISRIAPSSGQLSIDAVVSDILQANQQVFISDTGIDPTVNGQFRRNGVHVKVFTNGGVVNLSDVNNLANKQLSNLSATQLNEGLFPDTDNAYSVGSSSQSFAAGYFRHLNFNGTVARTAGVDNFRIHRDTEGMTFQLGLEGTIEFGKWRWADKDNVDRVIWDINSTGKNYQYNFATGGFKIRQNAADTDGILMYPPGNSLSVNDAIIHANRAFGAGQGLLIQRAGINKMRFAEDIYVFDTLNVGGNNILSVGDITVSSDSTKNIGTPTFRFLNIYADVVNALSLSDNGQSIGLFTSGITAFIGSGDAFNINFGANDFTFIDNEFQLNNSSIIKQTGATNYFEQAERTTDPAAPTNAGIWYVKDVGGKSHPFFRGDTLGVVDLSAGMSNIKEYVPRATWQTKHGIANQGGLTLYHGPSINDSGQPILAAPWQNNTIFAYPFWVAHEMTMNKFALYVKLHNTTPRVHFAIYSNRTDGELYPETKQFEYTNGIMNTSSTLMEFGISDQTLAPGMYWICVLFTGSLGALTVGQWSLSEYQGIGWEETTFEDGPVIGFYKVSSTSFPTTFAAGATRLDSQTASIWSPYPMVKAK